MQDIMTFLSEHLLLTVAAVGVFTLLIVVELIRARKTTLSVTPLKATQLINHDNAVVIDSRSNDAFRKGHIIGAQNIPASEVRELSKKLEKFRTRPIIIACTAGVESQKLAALLLKRGYNAYSLAGGLRAWSDAQMPIIKE